MATYLPRLFRWCEAFGKNDHLNVSILIEIVQLHVASELLAVKP